MGLDSDGDKSRVKSILTMLGLEKEDVDRIDTEEVQPWHKILSSTERSMVSLARGLVSNPELLCIHKPTSAFSERRAGRVMQLLREYVEKKGVLQDPERF